MASTHDRSLDQFRIRTIAAISATSSRAGSPSPSDRYSSQPMRSNSRALMPGCQGEGAFIASIACSISRDIPVFASGKIPKSMSVIALDLSASGNLALTTCRCWLTAYDVSNVQGKNWDTTGSELMLFRDAQTDAMLATPVRSKASDTQALRHREAFLFPRVPCFSSSFSDPDSGTARLP